MHELYSTLEVIDSFYQDDLDAWITTYDKSDVVVNFLVQEFKRKGELLTIIDLRADPEPSYQVTYPILIGINNVVCTLACRHPVLTNKFMEAGMTDIWA